MRRLPWSSERLRRVVVVGGEAGDRLTFGDQRVLDAPEGGKSDAHPADEKLFVRYAQLFAYHAVVLGEGDLRTRVQAASTGRNDAALQEHA